MCYSSAMYIMLLFELNTYHENIILQAIIHDYAGSELASNVFLPRAHVC
jgi:succinate dehydrogenase hydrophobic anchor subunit